MPSTLSRASKNVAPEFGCGQSGNGRYKPIFRFFGLRENPFHISPDPRYLWFTRQTQEAFDALTYGIQTNQGLMLLTGEVGTGKTTITNYLLNWLRQRQTPTSFIFNSRLNVGDLIDFVLADFGISCKSNQKADKLALLTEWLLTLYAAGKTPVLIVDEAHGLPVSVLEELRILLNLETLREKLLQIVLVGQPELEVKLRRPELRQLRQRVTVRRKIGPLNSAETRGYIHRRLQLAGALGESVFQSDAINAVHTYSSGIPRVINILCEHALINAYADQTRPVSPRIVKEAAQEFQFDKIGPLDMRLDFNETPSTRAAATRSISMIVRVSPVEPAELLSTELRNIPVKQAPVPVVDNNRAAPVILATNHVGTANPSIAGRFAAWPRGMPFFSPLSDLWRPWRDISRAMLSFQTFHHAASSVFRWLQQPVRPGQALRRIVRGQGSDHPRRNLIFARVHGEIRKCIARL